MAGGAEDRGAESDSRPAKAPVECHWTLLDGPASVISAFARLARLCYLAPPLSGFSLAPQKHRHIDHALTLHVEIAAQRPHHAGDTVNYLQMFTRRRTTPSRPLAHKDHSFCAHTFTAADLMDVLHDVRPSTRRTNSRLLWEVQFRSRRSSKKNCPASCLRI